MPKTSAPKPDSTASVTIQFKTFMTENTDSSIAAHTEQTSGCNSLH